MDELDPLRALRGDVADASAASLERGRLALERHVAAAPSAPRRQTKPAGRPQWLSSPFVALGAVVATAAVATLVIVGTLGISDRHPDSIAGPPPSISATTATPFEVPTDCATIAGSTILTQWAPAFGASTLLSQNDYGPSNGTSGAHVCVFGSNDTHTVLTIVVGALESGPGSRATAEASAAAQGYTRLSDDSTGSLYIEPVGTDPNSAGVNLITNTAWITVGSQGTAQAGDDLLPLLQSWAEDVAQRLHAY
ncbi:hypothetical protein [Subtercola sp. YIM 133946]|uniref:hypothetical protein n=1 Tax=Subtercola sp. YIM 133946 TaxID=3118909 RepID=UPI002F92BC70